ncbi:hypothetical protein BDY24DRAFT_63356 [Mrakia frigida]|uniref:uncharacterized protein n=1 Tax=Mrakia frigida TaxID=29902 RepID=UPI003FCC09BA
MRAILLQSRRINSRPLLLPRLPSPSSSLHRRFNSTSPSSDPFSTTKSSAGQSTSSKPSLPKPSPPTSSSSSKPPSTRGRAPPPPLRVSPSSTATPQAPTPPSAPMKTFKSGRWWSQTRTENRRERARALVERLGEGGEGGIAATPDFEKEAQALFRNLAGFAWPTEEDLRLLSSFYVALSKSKSKSKSPSAVEDVRRKQSMHLLRLLKLFTRRSDIKSDSFVGSLLSVLQQARWVELAWDSPTFRLLAVDLASGATNASEAVEIVEGLRRLSPSSFTESEFEEVLQAIGRVEDWTTTTRNTFGLPSFPDPILPPSQPPLRSTSNPPRLLEVQSKTTRPSNTTKPSSSSSSTAEKDSTPAIGPSRSSSKTPTTPKNPPRLAKPTTTTAPTSSPPSSASQPISSPSPPSSTTSTAKDDLLRFARVLSKAPPPTFQDFLYAHDLHTSVYPIHQTTAIDNDGRIETAVHILVYASRTPPLPLPDKDRFAGLISVLVHSLGLRASFTIASLGLDVVKDLLSLAGRLDTQGRIRGFAQNLHARRTVDYGESEMEIVRGALDLLPEDGSGGRSATSTYVDWERGFEPRLSDLIQSSASSSNTNAADRGWLDRASAASEDPSLGRGSAYALLERGALDAPSTLKTLVVASKLYSIFVPSSQTPFVWRQHGDSIVRILLLFSKYRGDQPLPFHLLSPALRHLRYLPPLFIPSTPSIPSFAIPLLPISTNLEESILVVNSILHAQKAQPSVFPEIWSTFLSSLEQHSSVPRPSKIILSDFFNRINKSSTSSGVGSPLEDLIQMYLRRWTRVEKEGGDLKAEEKALKTLKELGVREKKRERKVESTENALGEVRRVLEERKV